MKIFDVTSVQGIGEKKKKILKQMGLESAQDFLFDFPMRYVDRRQATPISACEDGKIYVIEAEVLEVKEKPLKFKRQKMVICKVAAHMYQGEIVFFTHYVLSKLKVGERYYFFGKIDRSGIFFKMSHPEFAPVSEKQFLCIQPIYHLSAGVSQLDMLNLHSYALTFIKEVVDEPLPEMVRVMAKLIDRQTAMQSMHFPKDEQTLKVAKYRFIYEEFFLLQLKLVLLKQSDHRQKTHLLHSTGHVEAFMKQLPFQLTEGQLRAIEHIQTDLISGFAMNRLIQGDVGSGKTIVALISMMIAAENGKQSVLMAPTTVLAEQHFESMQQAFGEAYSMVLLTSNLTAKVKQSIKTAIETGEALMVVGTQAIIQDDVHFKDLALVVTDEQHRFGVRQRFFATQKGLKPHTLVMSATPIPRTLSMILYGDMNVSLIKELPKNRKPIKTHFVNEKKRDGLYQFVEDEINQGRQAYFVCPLVETNEQLDLVSVEALYEKLVKRYPKLNVALIHGKLKADEKDRIMHAFKTNEAQILVSTTVIEVGVNVPNASVMVIVDAERFGLSQLHQLRGRVGRGADQAYCFLMSSKLSQEAKKRMETMINTNDGFEIAEKDLELRGPGEMFGLRQHGLPELKLANVVKHAQVLELVQEHIKLLMAEYNMDNKVIVRYFDTLRETIAQHLVL